MNITFRNGRHSGETKKLHFTRTVDDDLGNGFCLTDRIASRADVATSVGHGNAAELNLTVVDENGRRQGAVNLEPVDGYGLVTGSHAANLSLITWPNHLPLRF